MLNGDGIPSLAILLLTSSFPAGGGCGEGESLNAECREGVGLGAEDDVSLFGPGRRALVISTWKHRFELDGISGG